MRNASLGLLSAALLSGVLACGSAPGGAKNNVVGSPDAEEDPTPPARADAAAPNQKADAAAPLQKTDADLAPAPDAVVSPKDAGETVPPPADGGPVEPGIASGLAQMQLSRAIGLGYYHSCLITPTHEVKCFANVEAADPRKQPPGGLRAEYIFGAHNGFCAMPVSAVTPGGTLPIIINAKKLTCWGHKDTFFPPANLDMNPIQFGIGYDHGCVLNADHSVVCWGQGGTNNKPPEGLKAKSLVVASFFNCAVKEDDSVVCWGINPPTPPAGLKAKLVAATFHGNPKLPEAPGGTNHACAIQLDDTVKCWGASIEGNLDVPADLGPVRDIAVATYDSCALRMNGEPVCWGQKKYNTDATRYHPMPAGLRLKAFRAKLATYCGIKVEDDTIACWGDEQHDHITFPAGGVKLYVPK